jgi:hypothetical protein
METHGHEPAHAPHTTGFRWLDISLALSAFCVSLTTLWFAIHNARTMEKLVASNSYPNIDFVHGNTYDFGDGQGSRPAIYLSLANSGIGPARLRAIEFGFAGRVVPNLRALLALCCTHPAEAPTATSYWHSGDVRGAMLQAGKELTLFAWPETATDPRWRRLEEVMTKVDLRVCYCSVFDECYVRDSAAREPQQVAACPTPAISYAGD